MCVSQLNLRDPRAYYRSFILASGAERIFPGIAAHPAARTWGELAAYTDQTVTDPDLLEPLVSQVREQGYAVVRDELDVGLTAVAAPVRNAHGEVCASLSVSGPSFRMDDDRVAQVLPSLQQAAADVSARLGWHPR